MIATLQEWKDFLQTNVYKDMKEDIKGRKEILTHKLIVGGDETFSDNNIRGRISELDFIDTIVEDIVSLMEIEKNKKHTEDILNKLKGR